MADTNFSAGTVIASTWLDDVNTSTYDMLSNVAGTNNITASGPSTLTAYVTGQTFKFIPANSITGFATININGLGAINITKYGSVALQALDLIAGEVNIIVYDGTRFQLINPFTLLGRLINTQIITASGTFTPIAATTSIVVELVGGGGGGGGSQVAGAGLISIGVGGAGGGYCRSRFTSGFAGQPITIGAAGVGGAISVAGTAGGSSTFLGMTANGGNGGAVGGVPQVNVVRGNNIGATATGGNILNVSGGAAIPSWAANSLGISVGSPGGESRFGQGGVAPAGGPGTFVGSVGTGFGSGGAGGLSFASGVGAAGGNGLPGLAIIYEYS